MSKTFNSEINSKSFDAIKEAHHLSGEAEKLEQYYDQWSEEYDKDVSNEEYAGPKYVADYLSQVLQDKFNIQIDDPELEVLDAGCGTGLVGQFLHQKGFQNIDGFDLSQNMVDIAKKLGAYRSLVGGCDMTKKMEAYPDNRYQAIACCGVFTLGHVPPVALEELIRIAKPGGLIFVSTRKSYYDSTDFQEVCDRFQAEGKMKLVDSVMDGPYIAEEGAHYWAFAVC